MRDRCKCTHDEKVRLRLDDNQGCMQGRGGGGALTFPPEHMVSHVIILHLHCACAGVAYTFLRFDYTVAMLWLQWCYTSFY